ncbi:MAG: hypothetical protein ACK50J_08900 [Planctomyces sp.]
MAAFEWRHSKSASSYGEDRYRSPVVITGRILAFSGVNRQGCCPGDIPKQRPTMVISLSNTPWTAADRCRFQLSSLLLSSLLSLLLER